MSTALFVGLCITCNNAQDCGYRRLRGKDAIYCELVDNYLPPGSHYETPVLWPLPSPTEPAEVKGLCVNCLHRDACKLPRLAGGVWHCEEYELSLRGAHLA